MKKRIIRCLSLLISFSLLYFSTISFDFFKPTELIVNKSNNTNELEIVSKQIPTIEKSNVVIVQEENQDTTIEDDDKEIISQPVVFPDSYYNPETESFNEEEFWDDMELIALVCVAEAEGESEYGKRLVIDTILNRLESEYFPNTINEVIYAPGQYECVHNGRINRVEYNEDVANLVIEEFNNRTNSEVIYFRTNYYFNFGTPLLNEGSHYFSGR